MPAAKVPEDTKGTLNVLPAQNGLPEIMPVVMELVTLVIPDNSMLSILKGGSQVEQEVAILIKRNAIFRFAIPS